MMTFIPVLISTLFGILLQIDLSFGQKDTIFYNAMDDKLKFNYASSAVQFVIENHCPGVGTCAKMKVSDSSSWLETTLGQINTIGYIDIVLQIDFLFTGFGIGTFKIYEKNDISTSSLDHLIQSYDENDITQNIDYRRSFNLSLDAQNNDKLGIYLWAQSSVSQSAYIYIDNIYIFGTRTTAPTSSPSASPTNPTFSPTFNPIPVITTNPTINPTFYPTINPTKIPTIFPTKIPTFLPSKIPTISPTKKPTVSPTKKPTLNSTDLSFGVRFSVIFGYDVLINFSNITDGLLNNILVNVTEDLLDSNTQNVDNKCIKAKDYDINIDEIDKIIIINATIYVCNKETETKLSVDFNDNLQSDLLKLTTNNQILYVPKQNISIQVGIIKTNQQFISTLISLTSTDNINKFHSSNSSNHDPFGIIMITIGSIIFICILLIIFVFIHKAQIDKKQLKEFQESNLEKQRNRIKSGSSIVIPSYKIGEPGAVKHEYQLTPTDDHDMDNDNPFDAFVDGHDNTTNIIYDEQKTMSMDECVGKHIDNDMIKRDEKTSGQLMDGNILKENDETATDDILLRDEQILKRWLTNNVGLEQYYPIFMKNGYESLEFVKEITEKKQLMEIGIHSRVHLITLMNQINELKVTQIEDDQIVINGNDETPN